MSCGLVKSVDSRLDAFGDGKHDEERRFQHFPGRTRSSGRHHFIHLNQSASSSSSPAAAAAAATRHANCKPLSIFIYRKEDFPLFDAWSIFSVYVIGRKYPLLQRKRLRLLLNVFFRFVCLSVCRLSHSCSNPSMNLHAAWQIHL